MKIRLSDFLRQNTMEIANCTTTLVAYSMNIRIMDFPLALRATAHRHGLKIAGSFIISHYPNELRRDHENQTRDNLFHQTYELIRAAFSAFYGPDLLKDCHR
jgi:hypothetical protein